MNPDKPAPMSTWIVSIETLCGCSRVMEMAEITRFWEVPLRGTERSRRFEVFEHDALLRTAAYREVRK